MKRGHFVFYLKENISEEFLKIILAQIFSVKVPQIVGILEGGGGGTYEIRNLNSLNTSTNELNNDFRYEVNLYVPKDIILKTSIFNNLLLGNKVSLFLNKEVLVYNESDNAYLWLLINEDDLYLVKEIVGENTSISIDRTSKIKLSFKKALELLPGKEYYNTDIETAAFYVKDSNIWKRCVE